MRTYTRKEVKNYVSTGLATDVTTWGFDKINELRSNHPNETIGVSTGKYGVTGGIFQDTESGEMYAVTARSSSLFQML